MGGGIGMGNTCKPMAVSFQCMTKSTTKKKKKVKAYLKAGIKESAAREMEVLESISLWHVGLHGRNCSLI